MKKISSTCLYRSKSAQLGHGHIDRGRIIINKLEGDGCPQDVEIEEKCLGEMPEFGHNCVIVPGLYMLGLLVKVDVGRVA